jgi:hypothetical protein
MQADKSENCEKCNYSLQTAASGGIVGQKPLLVCNRFPPTIPPLAAVCKEELHFSQFSDLSACIIFRYKSGSNQSTPKRWAKEKNMAQAKNLTIKISLQRLDAEMYVARIETRVALEYAKKNDYSWDAGSKTWTKTMKDSVLMAEIKNILAEFPNMKEWEPNKNKEDAPAARA